MSIKEIQDEIIKLKKEKDICILAHCYQNPEILEVADFTGDSFGLSVEAAKTDAKTVIMCGVRFMAETVKILSPDKKVILSNALPAVRTDFLEFANTRCCGAFLPETL